MACRGKIWAMKRIFHCPVVHLSQSWRSFSNAQSTPRFRVEATERKNIGVQLRAVVQRLLRET